MPMADTIATAADYADAMMTARKAKNWLFLLLLLVLLIQLTIFFLAAYTNYIIPHESTTNATVEGDAASATPTTLPATREAGIEIDSEDNKVTVTATNERIQQLGRWLVGVTDFVGVLLPIVLVSVLMLIVAIMLVGRLIGVSRVTSAYIWAVVLVLLMFPWQALFDASIWRWSGALYTWNELMTRGQFMHGDPGLTEQLSNWWRFVGLPVLALLILLSIQVKSNRGMRQALGESATDISPVT